MTLGRWTVLPSCHLLAARVVYAAFAVVCCAPAAVAQHWSFQPRTQPVPPALVDAEDRDWVRTGIDAFVLKRLKDEGTRPAPPASRATLIRRLTFDLTGLPPTPKEVADFVFDDRPGAYERLVERLLASPHYGERWAQHWLDVVRFAETDGFEYDRYRPGLWRYRDYVIDSFNDDKSFDQFIMEQVAGDELNPDDRQMQIAVGFHRLGPVRRNAGNQEVAFSRNEVLTEMTDGVGLVFLGLTVGCARCHDHLFDDFPQVDYYRLQAYMAATHEHSIVLADPAAQDAWQQRTDELNKMIKQLRGDAETIEGSQRELVRQRIKELESQLPAPLPTIATVRNVSAQRSEIHVLERGLPEKKGAKVEPRLPSALIPANAKTPANVDRPRTELARWLADAHHPLTARVFVNRVWQYHFGRGLVETPNDFGANGGAPSDPALLDYLANEFVRCGMRIKQLHRWIVTSSTYRRASSGEPSSAALPAVRTTPSCFPRRRLSAEEVRDAMLSASGRLNTKTGGESVIVPVEQDLVDLLYAPSQWTVTADAREHDRRSIYLIAKRNLRLPFAQVFDQPDLQTSCPRRESSTHALQSLELLNGRTSNRLAEALAERLEREAGDEPARQIELAYLLVAGRHPSIEEMRLGMQFLATQPLSEFALAMFNLNAFLYVD